MKHYRITVWAFLLAGVLSAIAGLRDLFAPGFFSMSPRVPGNSDIITQFVLAVMFFAMAALFRNQNLDRVDKKS